MFRSPQTAIVLELKSKIFRWSEIRNYPPSPKLEASTVPHIRGCVKKFEQIPVPVWWQLEKLGMKLSTLLIKSS